MAEKVSKIVFQAKGKDLGVYRMIIEGADGIVEEVIDDVFIQSKVDGTKRIFKSIEGKLEEVLLQNREGLVDAFNQSGIKIISEFDPLEGEKTIGAGGSGDGGDGSSGGSTDPIVQTSVSATFIPDGGEIRVGDTIAVTIKAGPDGAVLQDTVIEADIDADAGADEGPYFSVSPQGGKTTSRTITVLEAHPDGAKAVTFNVASGNAGTIADFQSPSFTLVPVAAGGDDGDDGDE
jgi:hypothetical protein